jgi:hypothetical protein
MPWSYLRDDCHKQGSASVLRCEILSYCSRGGLSCLLPILGLAIGPHPIATAVTVPWLYMMTTINKRLLISESRGDSNRCTPCRGKPDQHATYASHASPRTPSIRFLRAAPYVATFHESSTELSKPTALEKKDSRHNPQCAADWSAGLYPSSLPSQPMKQWGQSQASINGWLLGLLGP